MNINKYKEKLLKEKNKLTGLIGEMKDNTLFGNTTNHTSEKYTSGELSSYDNHPADMGTDVYMQDMQNSLTNHEEGRLNNIKDCKENSTTTFFTKKNKKYKDKSIENLINTISNDEERNKYLELVNKYNSLCEEELNSLLDKNLFEVTYLSTRAYY